jgi:outer membrane lipoprotein SlyB
MKKSVIVLVLLVGMTSSCTYQSMTGSPAAVSAGASIGGLVGSIVGDNADGWRGSQFGALIGTIAGAAIGNAVTTPRNNGRVNRDEDYIYNEEGYNRREYTEARSDISIQNIRFIDENRDHVIEAGENSKLVFDLVNEGSGPAYNIVPVVEELSGIKHLTMSPMREISYMPQGNQIRYTITIYADKRLKSGLARFRLYTMESSGAMSEPHEFSLPTRRR